MRPPRASAATCASRQTPRTGGVGVDGVAQESGHARQPGVLGVGVGARDASHEEHRATEIAERRDGVAGPQADGAHSGTGPLEPRAEAAGRGEGVGLDDRDEGVGGVGHGDMEPDPAPPRKDAAGDRPGAPGAESVAVPLPARNDGP